MRAGERQLSLLGGVLTEQDRAVLELACGPGLQARVAGQAPNLLRLSPTRYFQRGGLQAASRSLQNDCRDAR